MIDARRNCLVRLYGNPQNAARSLYEDTSIPRLFKVAPLHRLAWPLGQVVEPSSICLRANSTTNPTLRTAA
jgi:hypothetical protein